MDPIGTADRPRLVAPLRPRSQAAITPFLAAMTTNVDHLAEEEARALEVAHIESGDFHCHMIVPLSKLLPNFRISTIAQWVFLLFRIEAPCHARAGPRTFEWVSQVASAAQSSCLRSTCE